MAPTVFTAARSDLSAAPPPTSTGAQHARRENDHSLCGRSGRARLATACGGPSQPPDSVPRVCNRTAAPAAAVLWLHGGCVLRGSRALVARAFRQAARVRPLEEVAPMEMLRHAPGNVGPLLLRGLTVAQHHLQAVPAEFVLLLVRRALHGEVPLHQRPSHHPWQENVALIQERAPTATVVEPERGSVFLQRSVQSKRDRLKQRT